MFASIRMYRTDKPGLVLPLVKREWLSVIKNVPGFINYYLIQADRDSNEITTVSIFDTKEHALDSDKVAAEWLRNNDMIKYMVTVPEITSGEVKVTSEPETV